MKRLLLSAFILLLGGCASSMPSRPSGPEPIPVVPSQHISHGAWEVTLEGGGWKIDEGHVDLNGMTQVLEATNEFGAGRVPIRFTLMTIGLSPSGEQGDAQAVRVGLTVAHCAAQQGELVSQKMVVIDERPASLTIIQYPRGLADAFVGTAKDNVGYVMICGGDVASAEERVRETCFSAMKSFHLK